METTQVKIGERDAGQPQPDDVGVPVSAPRRVRRKSAATDTASAPAVIAEAIERQIKTGELANGQRLPTEIEMAAQFGVARDTIRKALRSLAQRGLIVSSKRVGTFVSSDRIDYRISRESSFRSNMEDADRAASEQIIDCRTVIVPGDIANQLDIASKSQVIQIEELKLANDLPFVWRQSWYPADRFGRLETILTAGSTIREALTFHGIKQIYRARTQVHTRLPTALERRHLNMDRTDVAVVLEQLTVDGEDEPVSVGRAVLCSSRVNLVIET